MAPDDRIFEKALARHLRSSSGQAPEQQQNCADAETLAAYHERLLAPHELNAWKEHIAGCSRCQEILAQLEATEEIPFASAGEQLADSRVLAMPPQEVRLAHSAPAPLSSRRISPANWRWVVPAGALAAGLLVWVVSREDHLQKSVLQPSSSPVSVAENHRAAPAVPQSGADTKSLKAQQDVQASSGRFGKLTAPAAKGETRSGARGVAPAPANGAQLDELDRDQALSSDLRKAAPVVGGLYSKESSPAKNSVGTSNRALQQQPPGLAGQEKRQDDLKQPDMNAFIAEDKLPTEAAANKSPSAPPPPPARAYTYDRERNLKKERAEEKSDAPTGSALAQTVVVTGEAAAVLSTSAAALLATGGPRIFPVPGTKVIWKIDDDGRVRRTSDLGDSWQLQDVGVNATLLSGSAPSEKVCWLVGTFGTVVVTTDGGAHWTKRPLPVSSPVDRITAFDAQHAVVMLQSTNVRFESFDAGLTWTLVAKK